MPGAGGPGDGWAGLGQGHPGQGHCWQPASWLADAASLRQGQAGPGQERCEPRYFMTFGDVDECMIIYCTLPAAEPAEARAGLLLGAAPCHHRPLRPAAGHGHPHLRQVHRAAGPEGGRAARHPPAVPRPLPATATGWLLQSGVYCSHNNQGFVSSL